MRTNTGKNIKLKTGKSNLDIVKSYLNGERAFVQVGYDANVAVQSRKEGEEWEDSDGSRWIKKNGYKHRVSKKSQFVIEQRCTICNADMKWGDRLDQKIYPKTTRCYNCNIEYEGELKGRGLYKDYEKFKMINNELSTAKDFKDKVVDSINFLSNYDSKTKNPQFFNEDGSEETWIDDTDRRQVVLKDLNEDLNKVNQLIQLAEDELKKINYNPDIEINIKNYVIKKIADKEKNGR
jgi:hypothetical protein